VEQEDLSPELIFQCLLGLGFLPRFCRKRGNPESKALSIRLTYEVAINIHEPCLDTELV
jgi:hypothetical protein